MPNKPTEHDLERASRIAFEEALGDRFIFRGEHPDYGIDGTVEEFEDNGDTTGRRFYVQLKATNETDLRKGLKTYIKHDIAAYYRSLRAPVLMVRLHRPTKQLYARFFHRFDPYDERVNKKSLTFRWSDADAWDDDTADRLAGEARAFMELTSPSLPLPLDVYVAVEAQAGTAPGAAELAIELQSLTKRRADIVRIRTGSPPHGATRIVLRDDRLTFDLAGVTGASLHLDDAAYVPVEPLAVTGLALAGLAFERVAQTSLAARMTSSYFLGSALMFDQDAALALAGTMADAGMVTEALDIADEIDDLALEEPRLHESGMAFTLPAFVRTTTLSPAETTRYQATMRARIQRRVDASGEGAGPECQNLANHFRNRGEHDRALTLYAQARNYDPAYADRAYWQFERAGALFGTGRFGDAADGYLRAHELGGKDIAVALAGDARMYQGHYAEALELLERFLADRELQPGETEYLLKARWLREVTQTLGIDRQRRRFKQAEKLGGQVAETDDAQRKRELAHQGLRLDVLSGLSLFNLAVDERDAGEFTAAARHYAAAGLVSPWDLEAWSQAIVVETQEGDPDGVVDALIHTGNRFSADTLLTHLRKYVAIGDLPAEALEHALTLVTEQAGPPETFTVRVVNAADVEEVDVTPHRRTGSEGS